MNSSRLRIRSALGIQSALAVFTLTATLTAAGHAEPLTSDAGQVLATVNGEAITLGDLERSLVASHGGMSAPSGMVRRPQPMDLLDRLIDLRLLQQEARSMGLDELPVVTAQLEAGRLEVLKEMLVERQVADIVAAEPEAVEEIYRTQVREAEVESVLFAAKEQAAAFKAAVDAGADFGARAAELFDLGEAKDLVPRQYFAVQEMLPRVTTVLLELEPPTVSPPIELGGGATVVKLYGYRYPDDPEARRQAAEVALQIRRQKALSEYTEGLRSRYVKVDRDLVESLALDASGPGAEVLQQDTRVLAEVEGAAPVTVQDLMAGLAKKFFHGLDKKMQEDGIDEERWQVLDRLVLERAGRVEGERLGIFDSAVFRDRMQQQEEGLLFALFVARVIQPEIEVDEQDLEAYYADHQQDYMIPAMIRLEGLAFERREDAQAALEKLRQGADFEWMQAHADGQVAAEDAEELLSFSGRSLMIDRLPDGLRESLAGAQRGDLRFHSEGDGPSLVLLVGETIPARPRPFSEVRDGIAKRLVGLERQALLDRWAADLRAASEIEIFINDGELRPLLGLGDGEGS